MEKLKRYYKSRNGIILANILIFKDINSIDISEIVEFKNTHFLFDVFFFFVLQFYNCLFINIQKS